MDKYIINGVEYSRGEEVEVSDFGDFTWHKRRLVTYIQGANEQSSYIVVAEPKNYPGNTTMYSHIIYRKIRKIQPTQSLSGQKATLILDGTEHTVTFE